MLVNGADLEDCVIVELEARRAEDLDFDADEGAVLMVPTAVQDCLRVEESLVGRVRERAQQVS